ncbi:hypothetical protein PLESTB_000370100 [Pleodorina starrii]|uniref:PNPLA domain-containing protein n=1 Tax=Pleodorina starrii TaxID=330485 RepID=A0A9W6EZQ4_9CHLO|nr:hypothetical protein PLESTM_000024800 [Pleodorina starrii]GLC50356.1 hypothetical protein PLESTB_000370100 [Pleodorina starrii]GLC64262.1 hypothetical protein PLESTF_000142600 [Pleodorina starrii]
MVTLAHKDNMRLARKGGKMDLSTRLFSFMTNVAVLALWKVLWALSLPIGKIIALNLWLGKSLLTLAIHFEHQVLKAIGWLSSPALPPHAKLARVYKRNMGADVKNWHLGLATIVAVSVVTSAAKRWQERMDERARRRACLRRLLAAASSYEQWREVAQQLYAMEEANMPAGDVSTRRAARLYDRKLLLEKTIHLRSIRATGNVKEIMLALRTDLIRNIANIAKSQLHEHFVAVPEDIGRYLAEMKDQLLQLVDWQEDELPAEEKLAFFRETRHTFGRTALLLSGGGGLGTFHIGVVKALFEQRLLPRVLAGSSVGSIVCGIIATRTDAELQDLFSRLDEFDVGFFSNSRAVELVQHLINKGSLQDMTHMIKKLRGLLGDATFLEAYERTGRILNVTVCPADTNEPPRLLNYLTAPNAIIWSAVAASSAFPGLYPAQHILARNSRGEIIRFSAQSTNDSLERRWRDGSLELDLPVQALGEMFNCNHFLVSQTNPHIVPLLNLKKAFSRKWANVLEAELKHRCQVAQWLLPEWVPSKWLMLFTQAWEGDITMTLPSALWHIGKTIVNPTTEELIRSVKVGEVATWEKLSAIECNCTIEATLDKCLAHITNQVRGYRLQRMHNRIPSWLHMSAVGLPAVASWGGSEFAEAAAGAARHHASWGSPSAFDDEAAAAAAAAAGGDGAVAGAIGVGALGGAAVEAAAEAPLPAAPSPAASGAVNLRRASPSTHPLAVAASMTSSTLALLNLGGGNVVGGGSAILAPVSPPRGGPVAGGGGMLPFPGGSPVRGGGRASASSFSLVGMMGGEHRQVLARGGRGSDGGGALGSAVNGSGGSFAMGLGLGGMASAAGAVATGVPTAGYMLDGGVAARLPPSPPRRYGLMAGFSGGGAAAAAAGAGRAVPPTLPTWVDAASECEDSASDAAAATGSGAASSSAAATAGSSGTAAGGGTDGIRLSKELLDLAYCDCTDSSACDLWSALLPLARQSVSLGESTPTLHGSHHQRNAAQQQAHRAGGSAGFGGPGGGGGGCAQGAGADGDSLDVFAY